MIDHDLIDIGASRYLTGRRVIDPYVFLKPIRHGDSGHHRSAREIRGLPEQLQAAETYNAEIYHPLTRFGYNAGNYCRV